MGCDKTEIRLMEDEGKPISFLTLLLPLEKNIDRFVWEKAWLFSAALLLNAETPGFQDETAKAVCFSDFGTRRPARHLGLPLVPIIYSKPHIWENSFVSTFIYFPQYRSD